VGIFVLNNKIFVYLCKIKNMHLKTRLTLVMWSLPFPFIFIVFGKTIPIIATGIILMGLQMLVWGKLLSEVK
jgi:ABC-type multidrug transport system permease subunit